MSWLKYCTIFLLIARVRSQEAIIEINTKQAAYHVSENYVSFSVDAEDIFGNNFRNDQLDLAKMMSPAYVRILGLSNINIQQEDLQQWNEWFKSANITPVITIDYEPNNWHPRDTVEFLGMSREVGMDNCIWQFGQKLNSSIIPKYSEDILTFDNIVDVLTDSGKWGSWKVAAADMELDWDTKPHKLRAYYAKISPKANIMTIKSSPNTIDDSEEDEIENDDEEALRWSYSQRTDMWLSRPPISSMKDASCCKKCLEDGLRYAKSLGDAGNHGYKVLLQDIKLANMEPNMIFFTSLLHKQLMGSTVLDTVTMKNNDELVQFYTHCTTNFTDESTGSITIFGVNLEDEEINTAVKITHRPKDGNIMEFILTVKDNKILINGVSASTNSEPFPNLKNIKAKKSIILTLPARSIGFWVVPTHSKLCANSHQHKHSSPNKIFRMRRTSATNLMEELILDSLKHSNYHFFKDLKGRVGNRYINKVQTKQEVDENHKNNQIVCLQKIEGESIKKKLPLAKLRANNLDNVEKSEQREMPEEDDARVKRDVEKTKKLLPKRVQDTRGAKKIITSVYTSGLQKKNSAELSIFQHRDNFALPNGDVYADIGNDNDYDYIESDADEPYSKKDQYGKYSQQPKQMEKDEDYGFNTEQGLYMAFNPKLKQNFQVPAINKNEFLELGAVFKPQPQSSIVAQENPYQYRFSRSVKDTDSKVDIFETLVDNKEVKKDDLSKRKQKLYKTSMSKKKLLKKSSNQYAEKKNNKQINYRSQLLDNDVDTKTKKTNEIRSERSLKNKRKSQNSFESENQKIKRQIETSSLDSQIDKHVKSFQDLNDHLTSKLSERYNNELITEQFKNINDNFNNLQNHLKEAKEKLLSQHLLTKPSAPSLLEQSVTNLQKPKGDSNLLNNNDSLQQLFSKNPINIDDSPLNKEWPLLDHKSITDKIDQDLKALQERLSKVLHNKELLKTKSLNSGEQNNKQDTKNKDDKSEVYQPSISIRKLLKNKRNPLYLKHLENLEEDISSNIPANAERASNKEKRAIPEESSNENMIFSNSIHQDDDTEDFTQHYEEVINQIVILNETHDPENSKKANEEKIIIENFDNGDISKDEIIFVSDDNSTNTALSNGQAMTSLNIIDDMAHKLTDFVTYIQSQIKHWLS